MSSFSSRTAVELFNDRHKIKLRFSPSEGRRDCWDDHSTLDVKVTDLETSQKYHKTVKVEELGETSDFFDELLFHLFRDEIITSVIQFPQENVDLSLGEIGDRAFLILRFDLERFKPISGGGNPDEWKLHFRLIRKRDSTFRPLMRLEAMAARHSFEGELFVPLDKVGEERQEIPKGRKRKDILPQQEEDTLIDELATAMGKNAGKMMKKQKFHFEDPSQEEPEKEQDEEQLEEEVAEDKSQEEKEVEKEKETTPKGGKGEKTRRKRAISAQSPLVGVPKKRKSPRKN